MSKTPVSISIDKEGAREGCQIQSCPVGSVRLIEAIERTRSGSLNAFRGTVA